jgi:prepilin-type processing-associated H-X9-DG protein
MSEDPQARLSPLALAAFVLGVSSLVLSVATALPALFVGLHAIRVIHRADGRLRGLRLAIAGLVLAALMTLVNTVGLGALFLLQARELAARLNCQNNLRQLGQAIQVYSDDHDKQFPPGTVLNPDLPPHRRLSWQAALVPYLMASEARSKRGKKVGEAVAFQEAWDAEANAGLRKNVAPFQCPVFAQDLTPLQMGYGSYLGIAGVGEQAALLPLNDANAGFFGYDRSLTPADITAELKALITVVESRQANGPWAAGGTPTVRGLDPNCERYIGREAAFGGLHRNGANVLRADGSVDLVADKVDPTVFRLEVRISRP